MTDLKRSATEHRAKEANPYETALMLIGLMGLAGGLLTANLAFTDGQTSPWPGFLAQALILLGSLATVAWLLFGAIKRR